MELSKDTKMIMRVVRITDTQIGVCFTTADGIGIEEAKEYNFDLINFQDATNLADVIQRISVAGWGIIEEQERVAKFKNSPITKVDLSPILGREIEISLSESYNNNKCFRVEAGPTTVIK